MLFGKGKPTVRQAIAESLIVCAGLIYIACAIFTISMKYFIVEVKPFMLSTIPPAQHYSIPTEVVNAACANEINRLKEQRDHYYAQYSRVVDELADAMIKKKGQMSLELENDVLKAEVERLKATLEVARKSISVLTNPGKKDALHPRTVDVSGSKSGRRVYVYTYELYHDPSSSMLDIHFSNLPDRYEGLDCLLRLKLIISAGYQDASVELSKYLKSEGLGNLNIAIIKEINSAIK